MANFCRNCGTKLSPGARFCKNCGLQVASPAAMPAVSAPRSVRPIAAARKSGSFPLVAVLAGGGMLLLCVGAVVVFLILLGLQTGREEISSNENYPPTTSDYQDSANETTGVFVTTGGYQPRAVAPAETTPETVEGVISSETGSLALSDGTRVELPGSTAPVAVALSRATNTITLSDPRDLQTSGSMRVLEFDLADVDEAFAPRLTIPAAELGELSLSTVNVVRVGQFVVNGETLPDDVVYLSVERDADGNLVVQDGLIPTLAEASSYINHRDRVHMASYSLSAAGQRSRVQYAVLTFDRYINYAYEPRLVRMIPDASAEGFRRPADPEKDQAVLQKPIINVIVLVHGHNEEEKAGTFLASSPIQPWGVRYKREVWSEFYKAFLDKRKDQVDCTAFYEFIYPTYRSVYSPVEDSPVPPLGDSFASALALGAENDDRQLAKTLNANMPVNLQIVAHSMGGLVARAGIRQFNEPLKQAFQQLVTWGTPHHGSPIVTMGYLFRHGYRINPGKLREANWLPSAFSEAEADALLGSGILRMYQDFKLQLDTPGSRDLRWDNVHPLRLDEIFSDETKGMRIVDPNNEKYSLVNGTWLYNNNLRLFNESDPYRLSEKYTFIFGVTTKRLPNKDETAEGASLIPIFVKDAGQVVSQVGGTYTRGDSDGAVPLASMAGIGIVNFRADYIGDLDHEEYFSPKFDFGDRMANRTFFRLGLEEARCKCAVLQVEGISDLSHVAVGAPLELNAQFQLDPALDAKPGKRIRVAEALFLIAGTQDEFSLGEMDVEDSGKLSGSFPKPDLGEGEHRLVVRLQFKDDTRLESSPDEIPGYYMIWFDYDSNAGDGYCYLANGEKNNGIAFGQEGSPQWTGKNEFTVSQFRWYDDPDLHVTRQTLSGVLSPGNRSISMTYEYAYQDDTGEGYVKASFIDIPFVETVNDSGWRYDKFYVEGDLQTLYRFIELAGSFDPPVQCDSPGYIEIRLFR